MWQQRDDKKLNISSVQIGESMSGSTFFAAGVSSYSREFGSIEQVRQLFHGITWEILCPSLAEDRSAQFETAEISKWIPFAFESIQVWFSLWLLRWRHIGKEKYAQDWQQQYFLKIIWRLAITFSLLINRIPVQSCETFEWEDLHESIDAKNSVRSLNRRLENIVEHFVDGCFAIFDGKHPMIVCVRCGIVLL